jgi:hypothetical protein
MSATRKHVLGLDLGKVADYSAVVSLEVHPNPHLLQTTAASPHYFLDFAHRWPLKTDYGDVVRDVCAMVRHPRVGTYPALAVDETGVGKPVVDMIRAQNPPCELQPIHITTGAHINLVDDSCHVPKHHLVSLIAAVFQQERIEIARGPFRDLLVKELRAFESKFKTTTGNVEFAAWRENEHDDLVLAAALAVWWAEPPPGHHFTRPRGPRPAPHEPLPPVHTLDWLEERRQERARREAEPKRMRLFYGRQS